MHFPFRPAPVLLFFSILTSICSFSQVSLLKDINTNVDTSYSISSGNFAELNGSIFFTMNLTSDGNQDYSIWTANGSMTDVHKFMGEDYYMKLVKLNDHLIFSNNTNETGTELWSSDGTPEGTQLLKDLLPGTGSGSPSNLTQVGDLVYFTANSTGSSLELWKTDGTSNGTVKVKDFSDVAYMPSSSEWFSSVNNDLYFFYQNSSEGHYVIWKSDGTESGTVRCTDNLGSELELGGTSFKKSGNFLYFGGSNDGLSNNLWVTDGTSSGTLQLTDFNINNLNAHHDLLYFDDFVDSIGTVIWKTDGSLSGTSIFLDPFPGDINNGISTLNFINDSIYFSAYDSNSNGGYFKYVESSNQLSLITDTVFVQYAVETGNSLILYAQNVNDDHGLELYKLDSELQEFNEIRVGSESANAQFRFQMDSILIFEADNGFNGNELWKININDLSAEMVNDIAHLALSSNIGPLHSYNDKVFFSATIDDTFEAYDPWVTDGTTLGTYRLAELNPGSGSVPDFFVELNDTLYIFSRYPSFQIHKTDGTTAGTSFLTNVDYEMGASPATCNGLIYFCAADSTHGYELWKTDGTVAGTEMVKDILTGAGDSYAHGFTPVGNKVFFQANDGTNGHRLWVTDGTEAGTHLANSSDSDPEFNSMASKMEAYDNHIFFATYDDPDISFHLSDDVSSNSTLVATIPGYSELDYAVLNDSIAYIIMYGNNKRDLWKIDLTNNTPTFIQTTNAFEQMLYLYNDTVLFISTSTNYYGNELYGITNQSDSVFLIEDVYPGHYSSNIQDPMTFNNQLVFTGTNNTATETPFIRKNGHSQSVTNAGAGISSTWYKIQLNDKIIFSAQDDEHGTELWVYDSQLDTVPQVTEEEASCEPFVWSQNGHTYEVSGLYTDTLVDVNGNDSLIKNLSLVVNHPLGQPITNAPFVWQPDFGGCEGIAALNVRSADVYGTLDGITPLQVQNNGLLMTGNICHGIHTLSVSDSCSTNYFSYFVIPYPDEVIYNVNNTDILDSVGYINENCFIGYENIDTAYIQSMTFEDSVATVIWAIIDGQNTYLDTAVYIINYGEGNYIFQLNLYCSQKSANNVFSFTQSSYTTNGEASVIDNEQINLNLYPNPTNDQVTISFEGNEASLTIYDAQGKLIQTSKIISGGTVSLKDVQTGVYFFELVTEKGNVVKRVIKN